MEGGWYWIRLDFENIYNNEIYNFWLLLFKVESLGCVVILLFGWFC